MTTIEGHVYLLHFAAPYVPYPDAPPCACARHYTGWAAGGPAQLKRRLAKHGTLSGARLMYAVRQAGIDWELVRVWPGDRYLERRLKAQGGASRRCPSCGVRPRPVAVLPRNADGSVARSLTTDEEKALAGLMTSVQLAEHTALRRGAVAGRPDRLADRGPLAPGADLWARPLTAGGAR